MILTLNLALCCTLSCTLAASEADIFLPVHEGRDAYEPAIAYGDGVYLVVWKSGHLAPGDLRDGVKYQGDIVGCRLDSSGRLLDKQPVVICAAKDLQERPRVAFGGGVFLVVWQDLRNGKDWDVYAARITPQGRVLDTDGFVVSNARHSQALPDVSWDGQNFQVVWQDFRSGKNYAIYGARVSPDGKVLEENGRLLTHVPEPYSRYAPVAASIPQQGTLVFWLAGGRVGAKSGSPAGVVAGAHLLREGVPGDQAVYENSSHQSGPGGPTGHPTFPLGIAARPQRYLVAWTTQLPYGRGNAPNDSQAALFDSQGKLRKMFLLTQDPSVRISHPRAVWAGQTFWVVWHQIMPERNQGNLYPFEAIFAAQVTEDGEVRNRQRLAGTESAPAQKAAIASDGRGRVVIVYEQHPDKPEVPIRVGVRILHAGNGGEPQ